MSSTVPSSVIAAAAGASLRQIGDTEGNQGGNRKFSRFGQRFPAGWFFCCAIIFHIFLGREQLHGLERTQKCFFWGNPL
jgi:hypothetical protein